MNIHAPSDVGSSATAAQTREAASWTWAMPLAMGAAVYATLIAAGQKLLNDADTLWHIASGQWIFAHGAVPVTDPFSFSASGAPWVSHEWLADCVSAILYGAFGWTGLVVGAAAAAALAFAILSRVLSRHLAPAHAALATAASLILAASHMTARPHLFALPLMVLWIAGLTEARTARRTPSLLLLPVMTLWANMHGGFIIGLALTGAFALEALMAAPKDARLATAKPWFVFCAGAAVASLLTPHGFHGWLFPFYLMSLKFSLQFVAEWHAPDFTRFQPLEAWLGAVAILILLYRPRLSPVRIVLLLGIAYLAIAHARNAELLAIIGPLLLAAPLGKLLPRDDTRPPARTVRAVSALCMTVAVAATIFAATRSYAADHPAIMPSPALLAAREAGLAGNVLNDYDFGGYLIFSGVPVFVDGRMDLYGDDFMRAYAAAVGNEGSALSDLLERYRIGWTILPPRDAAVRALDALPGWRRVYGDDSAVVHARIE